MCQKTHSSYPSPNIVDLYQFVRASNHARAMAGTSPRLVFEEGHRALELKNPGLRGPLWVFFVSMASSSSTAVELS
jgi:hypothetical protein